MSDTSKIEWTDATWNPVTGCTKVSQGCKHCYAERLAPRVFAGQTVEVDTTPPAHPEMKASAFRPRDFTDVRCHPERLDAPLRWRTPRRIFVNSMSDLFHQDVPDEFILQVFDVMRQCENGHAFKLRRLVPQHTFQILTKRPARMLDFCTRLRFAQNDGRGLYLAKKLPHNGFNPMTALRHVWLGVSVEDQATADERIPLLLQTPAAVRFLSCEPLLGPISFEGCWVDHKNPAVHENWLERLNWVIAGGESGPGARPTHPDWIRSLRDQCAALGVPFFFKQWGEWAPPIPEGDVPAGALEGRMYRVGKRHAGRILDGRTHDEYPA